MTALSKQQIVETLGPSGHLWGLPTVNYIAPTIERTLSETEQRGRPGRATKARRDHESLYSSLFAHAPVMMHAIDRTERLIAVNDAWVSRMGYEQDEVIGRKSASFLTKASRAYAKSTQSLVGRNFQTDEILFQVLVPWLRDNEIVRDGINQFARPAKAKSLKRLVAGGGLEPPTRGL